MRQEREGEVLVARQMAGPSTELSQPPPGPQGSHTRSFFTPLVLHNTSRWVYPFLIDPGTVPLSLGGWGSLEVCISVCRGITCVGGWVCVTWLSGWRSASSLPVPHPPPAFSDCARMLFLPAYSSQWVISTSGLCERTQRTSQEVFLISLTSNRHLREKHCLICQLMSQCM